MDRKGSQKFAVLPCKFNDTRDIEPQLYSYFKDLFVNRGAGGLNDYWIDASLGNINLDGTKVFDWKILIENISNLLDSRPSRWDKILEPLKRLTLIYYSIQES